MDYKNPQNLIPPLSANDFYSCPDDGCTKTGVQYANVSTPVDITPKVKVGNIETECVGEPSVSCEDNNCKNSHKIIVTQKIRIKIPIEYNVVTRVGESSVDCDCNNSACE